MSIYPVKLCEWFPPDSVCFSIIYSLIKTARCHACGSKCRFKAAVGSHSLPWGNGDLFCNWECCNSGKVAKPDIKRERRLKRKFKDFDFISK